MQKTAPKLFHGKTARVHAPNVVEVVLSLEFGVTVRKRFRLVQVPAIAEGEGTPVTHAMVVLTGGKPVIVEPELSSREQWAHMDEVPARVYLTHRVHGNPVGVTRNLSGHRDPVLDISPFLNWMLANVEPDQYIDTVKRVLNGRRTNGGHRG